MVSGRLWLWAQELEQSPAQLPKEREKRIEYSGTVDMMGSGSIFQGNANIGSLNLGSVENQGLCALWSTFKWGRNFQSFKEAGAFIENTIIQASFQ